MMGGEVSGVEWSGVTFSPLLSDSISDGVVMEGFVAHRGESAGYIRLRHLPHYGKPGEKRREEKGRGD
jgi:hypothetical protein